MAKTPKRLVIEPDDTCAKFVGKTADKRQFFLTTPFTPSSGPTPRRDFLALYVFDAAGKLLDSQITDLGPRGTSSIAAVQARKDDLLASLGEITVGRIKVEPFAVQHFLTTFGLIADEPEESEDGWLVLAMPGAYMEFQPPWSQGGYDTFGEPDGTELLLLELM